MCQRLNGSRRGSRARETLAVSFQIGPHIPPRTAMTDRFLGVFRQSAFSSGFDRSRSRNACRVLRKDRQIPPKSSRRSCRQSGPPRCETLAARRRSGEGARRGPFSVPLRPTGALAATSVRLIRRPLFKLRKSSSEESSAHDRSTSTLSQPLLPGESMPNDGGEIIVVWFPPRGIG
jgi:hypothetical protein